MGALVAALLTQAAAVQAACSWTSPDGAWRYDLSALVAGEDGLGYFNTTDSYGNTFIASVCGGLPDEVACSSSSAPMAVVLHSCSRSLPE